eukprot:9336472-Ditylum_brightwellii.AAC.1
MIWKVTLWCCCVLFLSRFATKVDSFLSGSSISSGVSKTKSIFAWRTTTPPKRFSSRSNVLLHVSELTKGDEERQQQGDEYDVMYQNVVRYDSQELERYLQEGYFKLPSNLAMPYSIQIASSSEYDDTAIIVIKSSLSSDEHRKLEAHVIDLGRNDNKMAMVALKKKKKKQQGGVGGGGSSIMVDSLLDDAEKNIKAALDRGIDQLMQ